MLNLANKTVLITGGGGFIGSHLTELMVRRARRVRVLTQYNSRNDHGWLDTFGRDVLGSFEVVCGDVRDPSGVRRTMQGCDVVFHLAALIAIPYSYHSPDAYVETNIRGTLNVLNAARDLGTERVVHTSTSEVYGTARFVPITEEHPLQGQSPYSATKIGADQLALSYFASFGTPVSIARPFNTYGPRQSARAIIPTIITQIASGQESIKLGAIHPTRDLNYVEDTVSGFCALAQSDDALGQVFNLGSNFEIAIGDLAKIISEVMNKRVTVLRDDVRIRPATSEVERLWADNSKALRKLSWNPQYGGIDGLKAGLRKTVDWFAEPRNLSRYKADIYNI
jgi:NAD dependent epimerase/dehydratase